MARPVPAHAAVRCRRSASMADVMMCCGRWRPRAKRSASYPAVRSLIDETPGVQRSQLIQTGPRSLSLRLDVRPGAQPQRVWEWAAAAPAAYLAAQGLPGIEITSSPEPPQRSPHQWGVSAGHRRSAAELTVTAPLPTAGRLRPGTPPCCRAGSCRYLARHRISPRPYRTIAGRRRDANMHDFCRGCSSRCRRYTGRLHRAAESGLDSVGRMRVQPKPCTQPGR